MGNDHGGLDVVENRTLFKVSDKFYVLSGVRGVIFRPTCCHQVKHPEYRFYFEDVPALLLILEQLKTLQPIFNSSSVTGYLVLDGSVPQLDTKQPLRLIFRLGLGGVFISNCFEMMPEFHLSLHSSTQDLDKLIFAVKAAYEANIFYSSLPEHGGV